MKYLPGITHPFLDPITGKLSNPFVLPDLTYGYIWEGDANNTTQSSTALIDVKIDLRSIFDTSFILKNKSTLFPNAQGLTNLSDGLMHNKAGRIETSTTITTDELPDLGVTTIEGLELPAGQIWRGTELGRPERSDALSHAEADLLVLNAKFYTGHFIMQSGLTASFPKAQFLNALENGLLKHTNGVVARAIPNEDYVYSVQTDQVLMGGANNVPESRQTIALNNLPALQHNYIWQGNAEGRPEAELLEVAPIDAHYIIQQPDNQLTNAQALSNLVGLAPRILKATTEGVIEVAIRDEDYATKETLEQIKAETEGYKNEAQTAAQEASTSAEEASVSATEASASATEAAASAVGATGAAGEATAAAATASGSATAAGVSAAAAASALAAAGSASSASSSASDAEDYSDSAKGSADSAAASLHTLLTTGITLTGDIYASGGLQSPIITHFTDNPHLPGNAAMRIPGGNHTARPDAPVVGMMRFNTG